MAGEGDRFDYIEQLWRDAVAAGVEPLLSFPQRRWKEYISNFSCAFEAQQPTDLLNGITRQKPRVNRNITYQGFLALEALVKERPPCEHEIQNAKMHFFGQAVNILCIPARVVPQLLICMRRKH